MLWYSVFGVRVMLWYSVCGGGEGGGNEMLWYVCVCVWGGGAGGGARCYGTVCGRGGGGGCYDAVNKAKILFLPDDTLCG